MERVHNDIDVGIRVELDDPDAFLKVKETLTRIGVASKTSKTLYQSVHILHKKGKYYLVHFKEMFLLDGKSSSITEEDIKRRNLVAQLLVEWGLLRLSEGEQLGELAGFGSVKILPYKEKNQWLLESKYTIGVH